MNLILIIFSREEFFTALKKVYYETCNDNLPIYGINGAAAATTIRLRAHCLTDKQEWNKFLAELS